MKRSNESHLAVSTPTLVMAIILAACTTTPTPARQVDDATIDAAVKARLTTPRFSDILNIDVNVTKGVVTLAGEAPSAQVKMDAADEVLKIDGVVRVNNNLQLRTPPSR